MSHLTQIIFILFTTFLCLSAIESKSQFSTHLDIVFALDTTGSMSPYIQQTKQIIESTIKKYLERSQDVKFGVVAYRDFPPEDDTYITKIQGLTDAKETIEFLKSLEALGGGDSPEAVLTALYEATTKIQWRNLKDDENIKYKKGSFSL